MVQVPSFSADSPRYQRPLTLALSVNTKVQLEALEILLRQSPSDIVERAIAGLVKSLEPHDRNVIDLLTARVLENLRLNPQWPGREDPKVRVFRTVKGRDFRYSGSIEDGVEIHFHNAQSLTITAKSIERIREEIASRKGPVLMGAIYSPLMPNSIGEAIYRKYELSPINLSYVVPLLRERNIVTAFKKGRCWYVETVHNGGTATPKDDGISSRTQREGNQRRSSALIA